MQDEIQAYKETITAILKNLADAHLEPIDSDTPWKEAYYRDVQWLLKQLADMRGKQRLMAATLEALEADIPNVLSEASKGITGRIHALLWPKIP
jgi:hypothetical protein